MNSLDRFLDEIEAQWPFLDQDDGEKKMDCAGIDERQEHKNIVKCDFIDFTQWLRYEVLSIILCRNLVSSGVEIHHFTLTKLFFLLHDLMQNHVKACKNDNTLMRSIFYLTSLLLEQKSLEL